VLLQHLPLSRFIKDDYLQQNSFTKYDKYCPFYKSVEMMRNICTFHRLATAAVEKTASGNAEGQKITLNIIKQRMSDVLYKVTSQKFEDPGERGWEFLWDHPHFFANKPTKLARCGCAKAARFKQPSTTGSNLLVLYIEAEYTTNVKYGGLYYTRRAGFSVLAGHWG
jgi:hypothetical protein